MRVFTPTTIRCLLPVLVYCSTPVHAADTLLDALRQGEPELSFRLRYEEVDDSVNRDAEAITLRTRFGYRTGSWRGWQGYVQIDDTAIVGADDFAPETAGHAVIPDPDETELNQAWLRYTGIASLTLTAGRQAMVYDNQRFMSTVGWRQDDVTFTALRADYRPGEDWQLSYAFQDRVFGILPAQDHDVRNHLLNLAWTGVPFGKLVGYAYFLEDEDAPFSSNDRDNDTVGLRYTGSAKQEKVTWSWALEYADHKAGSFDTRYRLVEGQARFANLDLKAGQEWLGSDDGAYGMQTPYALKHGHNGWADRFLATPAAGLEDRYVAIGTRVLGTRLLAVHHDYDAEHGETEYGSEWNLLAVRKFSKRYTVGIKYANYQAQRFSSDTNKLWLWVEAAF